MEEENEIKTLTNEYSEIKYKTIKCNGCDCCNICEQKVAIPYIFMIYNIYKITNNKKNLFMTMRT